MTEIAYASQSGDEFRLTTFKIDTPDVRLDRQGFFDGMFADFCSRPFVRDLLFETFLP